jgi:hypothetical protein
MLIVVVYCDSRPLMGIAMPSMALRAIRSLAEIKNVRIMLKVRVNPRERLDKMRTTTALSVVIK